MACDDALKKASFRRQMAVDQIIVTFKLKAKVNLHTTHFEWDWSKSTSPPQKICSAKSEITNLLHYSVQFLVRASKYYFFSYILAKFFAKIILIYFLFFITLQK